MKLIPEKNKVLFNKVKNHVNENVTLECWLYNKRGSGKIAFLQLRDGTGFMQGIAEQDKLSKEDWDTIQSLSAETAIQVSGQITKHPKKDEYEIQVSSLLVIDDSEEYPIGKKEHGPEFLFENRDLYLRSKTPWAVLRIRNQVFLSITNFLAEEDFIRFDSPVLQPTSAEDTTQLFSLKYFEEEMYLTQSGQLYAEAGIMGFNRVYDFGPVFRAEKSKTRNHLSEFWMMDAEMAFYDQDMNMDLQERLIKRIIKDCIENCKPELELLERDTTILQKTVNSEFIRMTHKQAKSELEKDGFQVEYLEDMTTEEEIALGNKYELPIFITNYPFEVKSFYMKSFTDEDGNKRARCSDLIAPEEAREVIGGRQREDNYEILKQAMEDRNYPMEEYDWYLNVRKYGSVPHSGFGVGLERMTRWISGVHHIRETIPFPRTINRSRP